MEYTNLSKSSVHAVLVRELSCYKMVLITEEVHKGATLVAVPVVEALTERKLFLCFEGFIQEEFLMYSYLNSICA